MFNSSYSLRKDHLDMWNYKLYHHFHWEVLFLPSCYSLVLFKMSQIIDIDIGLRFTALALAGLMNLSRILVTDEVISHNQSLKNSQQLCSTCLKTCIYKVSSDCRKHGICSFSILVLMHLMGSRAPISVAELVIQGTLPLRMCAVVLFPSFPTFLLCSTVHAVPVLPESISDSSFLCGNNTDGEKNIRIENLHILLASNELLVSYSSLPQCWLKWI